MSDSEQTNNDDMACVIRSHNISHPKKRAFLIALSETGNVTKAAECVGIARRTHYDWLSVDDLYRAAVNDAQQAAGDRLEIEARRRAVEGIEKPVFQGGQQVGVVREYSDTLLIFLMKGAMPDKYQERRRVEVSGTVQHQIERMYEQARGVTLELDGMVDVLEDQESNAETTEG